VADGNSARGSGEAGVVALALSIPPASQRSDLS
jgi:hypothetical protein